MEIRHLKESDDRNAVSRIYEESWKFAYHGIIPQNYLDSIPSGNWAAHLDQNGMHTLVMLEQGEMIGTSSYCASRSADFAEYGEIVSIYLRPQYMGKGYGKKLMDAVIAQLVKLGYSAVFLWVLEENQRARRFYEKAGFVLSGKYLDDTIGGKNLKEVSYCRNLA